MRMSIKEALKTIKDKRWTASLEKYREAIELITETTHKYEKIEKIIEDVSRVKEVLDDGNDD